MLCVNVRGEGACLCVVCMREERMCGSRSLTITLLHGEWFLLLAPDKKIKLHSLRNNRWGF